MLWCGAVEIARRCWRLGLRNVHVVRALGAALVVVGFCASRYWYRSRGVSLDVSPIAFFDQLIDPGLLKARFWESIFYLSGQPPLYNALTALALKLSPGAPALVLGPVFFACGLYIGLALYVIMLRLRVPALLAAAVAVVIVATPTFVLYESWYFYPHLNVAWLVGGVAWLAASRGRPGPAMAVAAAHFGGLVLTRSLFHPLFLVLMALVTASCVAPGHRRRALVCFVLPAALVIGWCGKNQALFGFFGTSAWASRNISRSVETLLGPRRVERERARGLLSAGAGREAFVMGDAVVATFGLPARTTGVPLLDQVSKPTASFHPFNYNHWAYPATAPFYAHDVKVLLAAYPATYLRGLWNVSLPNFFRAVDDDFWFFRRNRGAIPAEAAAFDAFELSPLSRALFGLGLLLAVLSACASGTPRATRIVLLPSLLAILWVSTAGLVGEIGENNRFRYKVLWLIWALAVAGYAAGASWVANAVAASRWRRRAAGSPAGSSVAP
jgi:hypothetical protein